MPAFLVLAFVIVPLIELMVILQIGQLVGPWWTIALLVAFSIAGALLLRHEGRRSWRAFRTALEEGRWPGDEVTQGALVIVGGTLLLTPGFFTDGLGLLMLIPLTRAGLSRVIRARITPGSVKLFGAARSGARRRKDDGGAEVLDVEVVDIERERREPREDEGEGAPEVGPPDGDPREG
jgi:UPF0716 protein FxsA